MGGPFDALTAAQRYQIRDAHARAKEQAASETAAELTGTCWCETPLYPARGSCPVCVAARTRRTLPGHPVRDGAGYDCNCGACLALPARKMEG